MDIIRAIEAKQIKENAENFSVGDTVKVFFKIVEQQKEFRHSKESSLQRTIAESERLSQSERSATVLA